MGVLSSPSWLQKVRVPAHQDRASSGPHGHGMTQLEAEAALAKASVCQMRF